MWVIIVGDRKYPASICNQLVIDSGITKSEWKTI